MNRILLIIFCIVNFPYLYANADMDYNKNMQQLIQLAKKDNPKFPFAAMIVDNKTGNILCTGVNSTSSDSNPTLHGEIVAINNCVKKYGKHMDWKNSTLLTTAEPCPMCMSAIIWAGISTVVYGTSIKYLSSHGWQQIDIDSHEVAKKSTFNHVNIIGNVMESQTNLLFSEAP